VLKASDWPFTADPGRVKYRRYQLTSQDAPRADRA